MRSNLNTALAFAGLAVDAAGKLTSVEQARTLSEARRRAQELREDLASRGVHPDVLRFCTGDPPMLAINALQTESEKSEQKGFANLLRGTFGMFRNTTAHVARINWPMTKDDAEDLFSLVSLIHRRLDGAHMPPRV